MVEYNSYESEFFAYFKVPDKYLGKINSLAKKSKEDFISARDFFNELGYVEDIRRCIIEDIAVQDNIMKIYVIGENDEIKKLIEKLLSLEFVVDKYLFYDDEFGTICKYKLYINNSLIIEPLAVKDDITNDEIMSSFVAVCKRAISCLEELGRAAKVTIEVPESIDLDSFEEASPLSELITQRVVVKVIPIRAVDAGISEIL